MPTIFNEGRRHGAYIVSEAAGATGGMRSREVGVITGAASLVDGTVLGQVSVGAAVAAAKGGNTGNATISAVVTGAGAKSGVYSVEFTAATKFDVIDPDGFKIKSGATGAAYADDLGFTITVGATPMVAGDGFNITVAAGTKKFKALDPAGVDGSQVASAVLFGNVDATLADKNAVVSVRETEVNGEEITWPEGISGGAKTAAIAALAANGIIVR
ncbi:head decoration protein [Mesorhizobium sp. M6A.T.Cr.TU.016.01.1.1]|uniref:head decoration protein n=1 Tax=Mesorhizobium sp. M6A.T.Cr.TU.016.01.1.1 TaxID=2493677 RepID=UPI000F761F65|nr:head decoration protein [Mesorhizobium sp. M6A.T.Cr.TU.016.01.1.1]AZO67688.1 head decoration protein [Mesorhizobium sp. M6A.T.Cr.TU.016.01.1.1]